MKPNLFIVGAPKCGTTAWVHYLSSHPDVFFPEMKEPHYFSFDGAPHRRISLEDYLALYANAEAKVVGDGSTSYLNSRVAAEAISDFDPQAKILIFIRDQEHYLRSWHNQLLFNGAENIEDFETAWRLSGFRDETNTTRRCWNPVALDYKSSGIFSDKIERYLSLFGSDQVRVLHFRNWVTDPRTTYMGLLDFLGLNDDGRTDFPPVNEARHRRTNFMRDLVRTPPGVVRLGMHVARRVTGKDNLGLGEWAKAFGTREGYSRDIGEDLRNEIREYFREDNERIGPLIWKPRVESDTDARWG